jgi:hypothetical protein
LLTDEEMMATEVTPSAMAELTDLGKCLMKHEVSKRRQMTPFLLAQLGNQCPLFSLWAKALRKTYRHLAANP